jgi:Flp pilus assembly protein TadB
VTGQDPYTPPEAAVRDVVPAAREKHVVRGLFRLLDNEDRRAARNRFVRWCFAVTGIVFVAIAVVIGESGGTDVAWSVLIGAIGGYFTAFSAMLAKSNRNWPVIRRYFDIERVRADYASLRD